MRRPATRQEAREAVAAVNAELLPGTAVYETRVVDCGGDRWCVATRRDMPGAWKLWRCRE